MITASFVLPLILASASASASASSAGATLPAAPVQPFSEERYGVRIDDPYRWMEDPAQAAQLQAWMKQAGEATRMKLEALPERASFKASLNEATRAGVAYSGTQSAGGRLFYLRRDPDAAVPKLVVRDRDGSDRVLVDPGAGEGGARAVASFAPSPDGTQVAVLVGEGGGELGRFAILDVATGSERWRLDGTTFGDFELSWLAPDLVAYTRGTNAPESGRDPLLDMQAMVVALTAKGPVEHVGLGSQLAAGPKFEPQEFPQVNARGSDGLALGFGLGARADARILVTTVDALRAGEPRWLTVAGYEDQVAIADIFGDQVYYVSTREASNGALYRRRVLADGVGPVETVVPSGDLILSDVVATRDGVYLMGSRDGVSRLLFLAGGEGTPQPVALPFESELVAADVDADGGSLVFGLQGWTTTRRSYRATGGKIESLGLDSANWAPTQAFVTERHEATSRDGTLVPMVVLRKPGTPGVPVPTVIEGYGSYGVLTTSPFSTPFLAPWVERGGVIVFCGTRGGGERGRAWHEGGREANKPNAHDDLAACAQRVHALGIATPATTVVMGTSAGGLLAPPTALKHPQLFAGLMPRVAILNPTRLEAAPNGPNQFAEMGDPRTREGFKALQAQDAYAMLAEAGDLPDTLVTVGMNDTRVVPWMAAKFAARASARFGDRREVLLRVDTNQGHGIGSSRDAQIEEFADAFAWAWNQAARP
jgi:prolyl oligopeptidase